MRLAKLSAKGDPYTTRETLENSLKLEGAKVGADFVLVTGYKEIEDNSTPHFAEYGAGISIADDVKNPYLFGLACRAAKAGLGVELSKDWNVKAVIPGSVAENIGLQPSDRLVDVNGNLLHYHEYMYERDILSRSPGGRVTVDYLTKGGAEGNRRCAPRCRPLIRLDSNHAVIVQRKILLLTEAKNPTLSLLIYLSCKCDQSSAVLG